MKYKGRVFIVDDDETIAAMLERVLKKEDYEVRKSHDPKGVVESVKSWAPDIVLLDITLPGMSGMEVLKALKQDEVDAQVIMLTADDSAESAVKAMKLGAIDYITKPFIIDEVKLILGGAMETRSLRKEVDYLRQISSEFIERDLVGHSAALEMTKEKIAKLVDAHVSNILITGESGTGKEVVARYIHHLMSANVDRYFPFIAVNCTALSETLIESELFGYEKGAFTDAKNMKRGLFEIAQDGILLLDEIGDMKLDLQSKLLRVLEERTIRRIGGKEDIPIDVTVITTTNRDLEQAVEKGDFRMDLFYRLYVFALYLPPLRERKEDIMELTNHYLRMFATKYNKKPIEGFSQEAEKYLLNYQWPGNVRELRNVIEKIVVLETTDQIKPEHLPREIVAPKASAVREERGGFVLPEEGVSLEDVEKSLIQQALEKASYNRTKAAKLLNITYDTFRYQLKKYGL